MSDDFETHRLVVLNDDDTYTSSAGSHYVEFYGTVDDVVDAAEERQLLARAGLTIEVDDLVAIVRQSARAFLGVVNGWGPYEMEPLAKLLIKAGIINPEEDLDEELRESLGLTTEAVTNG